MPEETNKEEAWKRPLTFADYLAQFPDWHKQCLGKRYPAVLNQDFEDVAQQIIVRSIERKRVEKYDPSKRGQKDTPGLFLHYMGTCFGRDLATILQSRKAGKRDAGKSDSLQSYTGSHEGSHLFAQSRGGDDHLAPSSRDYAYRTEQEGFRAYNSVRLAEFRRFVAKHHPNLLPVLDAMESGEDLGISRQLFSLRKMALKGLAKHFENGTKPKKAKIKLV